MDREKSARFSSYVLQISIISIGLKMVFAALIEKSFLVD